MEEKNKGQFLKNLMIVIITALITCIITTIIVYKATIIGNKGEVISIDKKVSDIKEKLEEIYIGEIDEKKMIESALEGYVAALGDEYTEYLTEEEVTSILEDVNGAYVGVGLYIAHNTNTNQILVVGVIQDSPANKAGILVGDIIKKVDDIEYSGEKLTQASNNMKGIEGTKVKITVERDGKEIDYDITRETIKFKTVSSEKLENNIGYIEISSFDGGTSEDFKKAYKELEKQGISSLIIDLRNNGGGFVEESLEIAELMVPKGSTMLITKDKKNNEEISKSSKEPIIKMPICILVNEYTASASEILTAAIKENTNAKVIGTKTYGKGIIQGVFLFNDKKTGMKITMQEYFTPKHNKLHKIGITPDEVVDLPEEWEGQLTVEKEFDTQLHKAIEILK